MSESIHPTRDAVVAAIACIVIVTACLLFTRPARAEKIGPCEQDKFDGYTCGSGVGAARVIAGTLSPDKTLAFAWRDPDGDPSTTTEGENEFLLVRLSDGAVLAKGATDFFATGEVRANHRSEEALWSPDSRYVVRIYDTRYDTDTLTLYALAADGASQGQFDLRKIVEPVLRARLKQRGRNPDSYTFAVVSEGRSLDNNGKLGFRVSMSIPKKDPVVEFSVDMKAARAKAGVSAKITKVQWLKAE